MTLGQFATAVGVSRRWVQNAHARLGLRPSYTAAGARRLAFARAIQDAAGMPLARAWTLAAEAIAAWPGQRVWTLPGNGPVAVTVDLERLLSDCSVRLSLANSWYAERRRGRPPRRRVRGVAWAKEYGEDVTLFESTLRRTPAERLRAIEEAVRFIKSARRVG